MYVAKTKALISRCAFVLAYAERRFSHDAAHMISMNPELAYNGMVAMTYVLRSNSLGNTLTGSRLASFMRGSLPLHGGVLNYNDTLPPPSQVCYLAGS